jgi:hypothetical protein
LEPIEIIDPNDSIFTVYVNDFNDGYHDLHTEVTELEIKVKSLKNKYRYVNEYNAAVNVYFEYMFYLYNKYGGEARFNILLNAEEIPEFVPQKPKLKNTKMNKYIMKKGIVLSRKKSMSPTSNINDYLEEVKEFNDDDIINEEFEFVKKIDNTKFDINAKEIGRKSKRSEFLNHMDIYFSDRYKQEEKKSKIKMKPPSLYDVMNNTKRYQRYLKKLSKQEEDELLMIDNNFISKKDVETYAFSKELKDAGWNSYKIIKNMKGENNTLVRILKRNNKKRKEETKRSKKKKKKVKSFLDTVIDYGEYDSFADFEKEYKQFTSSNILHD